MDVNQVLKSTLSPDSSTRTNAEQQLSQAAEADFSGYLQTLARELASDTAERDVRMAAGLALKNSFSTREFVRLREIQARWLQQLSQPVKTEIKAQALKALGSPDSGTGTQAAQFVASIAAMEMPRSQWSELMPTLVQNVGEGADHLKQASLNTIGFICEMQDGDLQNSLSHYSNSILTAVVQGARKEEANINVRSAAITALGDSLEFVRSNFENEGERNYIMQVVCEATQADDTRIQQGAFGCLNRIMVLYYDKMRFYMERALFGLTIQGMKSEDEDVSKLAIEFWCSVCEEEISIEDDNLHAANEGSTPRPFFNFVMVATQEVVPVLLALLSRQDEDSADDEYNVPRAAYQCLQLWAQAVGNSVVTIVIAFIEPNIRNDDWHMREAAVSAFGAIVEGPEEETLSNLVKQALPVLIGMMQDNNLQVRDSVAFTLGRISDVIPHAIDVQMHLQPLVAALFGGLSSTPKIASSCCWALMNLAERFAGDLAGQENPMTPFFDESVQNLMNVTERNDQDNSVRTAAYEVLNAFTANAANSSLQTVVSLLDSLLQRLEGSIPMRQQVVSVEDTLTLDEIQTSLSTVIMSIVQRLDVEITPQGDRIMHVLLSVLSSLGPKSSVADSVFGATGSLAGALAADFQKYMDAFAPFLMKALGNREEPSLCAMAIGLVSDITRALESNAQPYCNEFMNHLLEDLRSNTLGNQCKPAILQCFGDIAQAIGGAFETYLSVVAQVLDQAASINVDATISYEMLDYVVSLREGIMDAWAGIIIAMKAADKTDLLQPHVDAIFRLLNIVATDPNRGEGLLRSSMGVIGDLSDAFPHGEVSNYYRSEWLIAMVKEVRGNPDFTPRTKDTAKWAREQLKRQTGTQSARIHQRTDPIGISSGQQSPLPTTRPTRGDSGFSTLGPSSLDLVDRHQFNPPSPRFEAPSYISSPEMSFSPRRSSPTEAGSTGDLIREHISATALGRLLEIASATTRPNQYHQIASSPPIDSDEESKPNKKQIM